MFRRRITFELRPGERRLVPLGFVIDIPSGYYGRLVARSSLARNGIDVAGGIIDSDYRGDLKVILVNNGEEPLRITEGERIAQLIIEKYSTMPIISSETLTSTRRGQGGFGSTGVSVRSLRSAAASSEDTRELVRQIEVENSSGISPLPVNIFFGIVEDRRNLPISQFIYNLSEGVKES